MALTFDLTGIENYRETGYDATGTLRPVTELLVFATMHVGMGEITEKNAAEFYARMTIVHKLHDIGINTPDGPKLLDPEYVQKHIGLTTNVRTETRAQWTKRMFTDKFSSITSDYCRNYRAAIKAKANA
jgi:hypothetical protein